MTSPKCNDDCRTAERAVYQDAVTWQAQAHLQAMTTHEELVRILGLENDWLEFTLLPTEPDRCIAPKRLQGSARTYPVRL